MVSSRVRPVKTRIVSCFSSAVRVFHDGMSLDTGTFSGSQKLPVSRSQTSASFSSGTRFQLMADTRSITLVVRGSGDTGSTFQPDGRDPIDQFHPASTPFPRTSEHAAVTEFPTPRTLLLGGDNSWQHNTLCRAALRTDVVGSSGGRCRAPHCPPSPARGVQRCRVRRARSRRICRTRRWGCFAGVPPASVAGLGAAAAGWGARWAGAGAAAWGWAGGGAVVGGGVGGFLGYADGEGGGEAGGGGAGDGGQFG